MPPIFRKILDHLLTYPFEVTRDVPAIRRALLRARHSGELIGMSCASLKGLVFGNVISLDLHSGEIHFSSFRLSSAAQTPVTLQIKEIKKVCLLNNFDLKNKRTENSTHMRLA